MTDPDNHATEFAIVVRSNLKGQGLGGVLMTKMIEYCRTRGTRFMEGQVLRENRRMRGFVASLGFEERDIDDEPEVVSVVLDLDARPQIVGTP